MKEQNIIHIPKKFLTQNGKRERDLEAGLCSKLASPILAFKVLTLNREEERSIEDTDRLEMQKMKNKTL